MPRSPQASTKVSLHGIPWGAKDIIAVKGYKTTWGSDAYKDQMIEEEASIVEMLREAGAVLLAKLTTGELAQGDRWFGGTTRNPWNTEEGSSGSSAGPASATVGGLVGFGIGSETSGSILSPSARCGATGLRPTFGRVSRYGVMALSWTQDRLGPLCRYAEDCAAVMSVIAKPDNRDMSVSDIPFNWNAHLDVKKLRVGYLDSAFAETRDPRPEEERGEGYGAGGGARGEAGTGQSAGVEYRCLEHRRGVGGVLRRADPHEPGQADDQSRASQRFPLEPRGSGGGVSAIAAGAQP